MKTTTAWTATRRGRERIPFARPSSGLLALLVALLLFVPPLDSRELAIDPDEMLSVELATVGVDRLLGAPVVLLREPTSGDIAPITVGREQGLSILRSMEGMQPPRPMTHDLIPELLKATDARVERVLVDSLDQGTYYGFVEVTVPGQDDPVRVDARPSDAMAIAIRTGAEIRVAPDVLQDAAHLDFELPEDSVVRALGITVGLATDELREALGLVDDPGVLVNHAAGEAEEAGIEPGALILSVDGEVPERPMEFLNLVRRSDTDEVTLRYWQDGDEHSATLSTDVPEPGDPPEGLRPEEEEAPGIPL